ncbi:MAG: serine hydrolase domain-containing protein [Robiginitomaculum sp.]|nr:serine hydrolase domain-containing protein [Robiginitomaculum sp.]MDQ7078167.1 serine hydrolase domain-containing protein [Robiginitomaculum sp.]
MLRIVRLGFVALFSVYLVSCTAPTTPASNATEVTSAPTAEDTARAARLDAFLATLKSEGIMPGASVLIYKNGKEAYFGVFGDQDRETGIPFARNTIERIYSMSKPITGVALMMLYEEGKFALDDPIAKYMPEYADLKVYAGADTDGQPILEPTNRPVTIRDLMRHTAGMTYGVFGDTPVDKMYREKGLLGYDRTNAQLSADLGTVPLLFQPGKIWHYSVAVDVQGRLIEVLSGQSLGEFLQSRIFEPLGMKETGFTVRDGEQARLGALYQLTKEGMKRLEDDPPFMANQPFLTDTAFESGGGGLVSTIDDYMRFARMLQNEGELDGVRLIKPETLALMTSDQLVGINHGDLGQSNTFGLDFAIRTNNPDGPAYTPGSFYWGGLAGTFFFVDPENDLTMVLFDQVIGTDAIKLRERLATAIYGNAAPS